MCEFSALDANVKYSHINRKLGGWQEVRQRGEREGREAEREEERERENVAGFLSFSPLSLSLPLCLSSHPRLSLPPLNSNMSRGFNHIVARTAR